MECRGIPKLGRCVVKLDKEISKIFAWKKHCQATIFSVKKYWPQRCCQRRFVLDTTGEKTTDGGDLKHSGAGKQRNNLEQDRSRWRETVKALCVLWRNEDRWWDKRGIGRSKASLIVSRGQNLFELGKQGSEWQVVSVTRQVKMMFTPEGKRWNFGSFKSL